MGWWEKVQDFFREDESWRERPPVEFEGRTYTVWDEGADGRAAWPNAVCARCGGVGLKTTLYWNRETDTWYHPEHMTPPAAAGGQA
jgi:hypothetical protein